MKIIKDNVKLHKNVTLDKKMNICNTIFHNLVNKFL